MIFLTYPRLEGVFDQQDINKGKKLLKRSKFGTYTELQKTKLKYHASKRMLVKKSGKVNTLHTHLQRERPKLRVLIERERADYAAVTALQHNYQRSEDTVRAIAFNTVIFANNKCAQPQLGKSEKN